MGRTAEPGISFFRMNCDAPTNRKVRLLIKDHGMAGVGVWLCILATAYNGKGYYFDMADQEELELFADEVCSMPLEHVLQIVESCIKRRLFNQALARDHQVLTSTHMQDHYLLHATKERRRKDTVVEVLEDLLLIEIPEIERNILIIPRNNSILLRNNAAPAGIVPRQNPHSTVQESKVNGVTTVTPPSPPAGAPADDGFLKECYQGLPKTSTSIRDFIRDLRPQFIEPYVALWNLFAKQHSMPQVKDITKGRRQQFAVRIKEKGFDFPTVLKKAAASDVIHAKNWFTFDWLIKNGSNYLKVLEGNYDNKVAQDNPKNQKNGSEHKEGPENSASDAITRKIQEKAAGHG